MIDPTGDTITPSLGAYSKDESDALFVAKTQVVQTEGTSTTNVMSQKVVTDELTALETDLNTMMLKSMDYTPNGNLTYNDLGQILSCSIIWADGINGRLTNSVYNLEALEYSKTDVTYGTKTVTYTMAFDLYGNVISTTITVI